MEVIVFLDMNKVFYYIKIYILFGIFCNCFFFVDKSFFGFYFGVGSVFVLGNRGK